MFNVSMSTELMSNAELSLQDVVMMCQTIEKLFDQKLLAMPKEVLCSSA